jgi:hypothetical protein
MKRLCVLTATIVSLLIMRGALPTGDAVAQQKSVKEQLLGTWTLVSIDYVGQDGSRFRTFGHDPKGIAIFDGSGHYIIAVMRSDRPKFAVNDRLKGTEEENRATAQGTITYFGTYSVSEADRAIVIHIVGSSFPNWNGSDQKRIFTFTGDELKLTNPAASTGGGTTEVAFKRAK